MLNIIAEIGVLEVALGNFCLARFKIDNSMNLRIYVKKILTVCIITPYIFKIKIIYKFHEFHPITMHIVLKYYSQWRKSEMHI